MLILILVKAEHKWKGNMPKQAFELSINGLLKLPQAQCTKSAWYNEGRMAKGSLVPFIWHKCDCSFQSMWKWWLSSVTPCAAQLICSFSSLVYFLALHSSYISLSPNALVAQVASIIWSLEKLHFEIELLEPWGGLPGFDALQSHFDIDCPASFFFTPVKI